MSPHNDVASENTIPFKVHWWELAVLFNDRYERTPLHTYTYMLDHSCENLVEFTTKMKNNKTGPSAFQKSPGKEEQHDNFHTLIAEICFIIYNYSINGTRHLYSSALPSKVTTVVNSQLWYILGETFQTDSLLFGFNKSTCQTSTD